MGSASMPLARANKDINRLALRLLRPGGLLFTFSCSGATPSNEHSLVRRVKQRKPPNGSRSVRLGLLVSALASWC